MACIVIHRRRDLVGVDVWRDVFVLPDRLRSSPPAHDLNDFAWFFIQSQAAGQGRSAGVPRVLLRFAWAHLNEW